MSDFKYHLRNALCEAKMAFGSLLWPIVRWRKKRRKKQPGARALTADEIADIIMESHKETE